MLKLVRERNLPVHQVMQWVLVEIVQSITAVAEQRSCMNRTRIECRGRAGLYIGA